ncbi:DUF6192 family protein [Streptomyces sp. NPDC049577]|uniref:DUF6192 family protein n=1 Tax=Streptomyces sp. NPDC049577 TaxID=3155153 RepID=UPI00343BDA3B
MSENIGQVTRKRYEEIVAADRRLVAQMGRAMFTIGDHALEIEPMRPHGGSVAHEDELFGVRRSLQLYADDIGLSLSTVLNYRFTSHRWPIDRRREGVSHKVHTILASIQDENERFEAVGSPPVDDVSGTRRWTTNLAKKHVGRRPDRPGTVQEKVDRVHDLAVGTAHNDRPPPNSTNTIPNARHPRMTRCLIPKRSVSPAGRSVDRR